MDVLVTGGTGFVGSHLCRELDDRGHDVTAFSRSPDDADLPPGVDTTRGDVRDVETVTDAAEGADAIVNLVALSPLTRPKGGERMHQVVHLGGTENCILAAEEVGVERFFQQSGIHADPEAPTSYLQAKGEAEEVVRESDLDHVIFRPTTIFGEGDEVTSFVKTVAPPYITPLPGGGRLRFQLIWVGDIVPMMADALEGEEHLGKTYEIGGPDVLTLAELAELLHRAAGRSTNVIPVPMELAGIGMRLGGLIPGFPFGPDQYRSLHYDLVTHDNAIGAFGVEPADLRSFHDYIAAPKTG